MIYPKYLNNGSTIGVTACSAGVLKKIEKYEKSINNVKKHGFNVISNDVLYSNFILSFAICGLFFCIIHTKT